MNIQKSQLCTGVNQRGLKGFDPYPYCQIYSVKYSYNNVKYDVSTFFQLGMKRKQVLVGRFNPSEKYESQLG